MKNDYKDKKLEIYRKKIDALDKLIVSNLTSRFNIVKQVGNYKKKNGIKIEDKKREKEITNIIKSKNIKKIYKLIFELSKSIER